MDVLAPFVVGFDVVTGKTDHPHVSFVHLLLQIGGATQFRRANGRKIRRVGEQDHPRTRVPIVRDIDFFSS